MADQVTQLAQELAQLRSEVETLSHRSSSKQTDLQNDLKSYARQKAELEPSFSVRENSAAKDPGRRR
jgi:TolA-binding protein